MQSVCFDVRDCARICARVPHVIDSNSSDINIIIIAFQAFRDTGEFQIGVEMRPYCSGPAGLLSRNGV